MRTDKAGRSSQNVDAVAGKLRAKHIDFSLDHVERAEGEIRHGDRFLDAIVDAVNALILVAGKMQDRLADGLAGDRAGVNGGSADHFQLFNERGSFSKLRRLNRGALSAGPRTDNDEIVLFHGSPREYITVGIHECVLTCSQHSDMILKICFAVELQLEAQERAIGLRVSILASGSSGNLTLLETERTRLLVDAGLGKRETVARLAAVEKTVEHLDGILITHEHTDHCNGLPQMLGMWKAPLYVTEPTMDVMQRILPETFGKRLNGVETIHAGQHFSIGDIDVHAFAGSRSVRTARKWRSSPTLVTCRSW